MGVLKLTKLFNDINDSFEICNVHLGTRLPTLFKGHADTHRANLDLLRAGDADISRLALMRRSFDSSEAGRKQRLELADIIVRRSQLLSHYAGPRELKDWAQLKELKNVKSILGSGDPKKWSKLYEIYDGQGVEGLKSVLGASYLEAVSEVQATIGQEITPEIALTLTEAIVSDLNAVHVTAGGQEVTVEQFDDYVASVTDGAFDRPEISL